MLHKAKGEFCKLSAGKHLLFRVLSLFQQEVRPCFPAEGRQRIGREIGLFRARPLLLIVWAAPRLNTLSPCVQTDEKGLGGARLSLHSFFICN